MEHGVRHVADVVDATDLILGALRTRWLADTPAITGTAPTLVYEPTEPDVTPHPRDTAEPWARVTVRHATGKAASLGNRRFVRTGTVWVQIFVPFTDGEAWTIAQRLAQVAQNAYEGQQVGGVLFPSVATPERGRDGSFWRHDCVATFEYHEIKQ